MKSFLMTKLIGGTVLLVVTIALLALCSPRASRWTLP